MNKISRLITIILLLLIVSHTQAQQKYAVLVGINKYYDRPDVQHNGAVLKGCVNDALAMKSMLKQRFGFSEDHITTLFDENASKKNVTGALNNMLARSKAGDAVIFYFSGHGIWMKNPDQDKREAFLKEGMDQAMVMSDLYADSLNCLFTDTEVKRIFNKFINKKVISTAIFDCCFSGMMAQTFSISEHNPYETDILQEAVDKAMDFDEILAAYREYQQNTIAAPVEDKISETSLPDSTGTRSFNLKDALIVRDATVTARPSERSGSLFLSLAATDDRTKGLDVADETGTPHGAYTCALLHVIRDNPSDLPVEELIRKTEIEIKKQGYPSTMHFQDNTRLSGNLLGIKPIDFNNHTSALCTANTGKDILLSAGLLDGLAVGNSLQSSYGRFVLKITSATANNSVAAILKGNASAIKPGDRFILTNSFTKISPYIKVFFSGTDLTPAAFNKLVTQDVIPLTKIPGYYDYENWDKQTSRNLLFFGDYNKTAQQTAANLLKRKIQDSFLIFLPIPSIVTNELSALLKRNQNIEVVPTPERADLILYLNYIKPKPGKKPHYVFTWTNLHGRDVNPIGALIFFEQNVNMPDLNMDSRQSKAVAVRIQDLLKARIRVSTDNWIPEWPE